jgi:hypothetical protein
LAQEAFAKIQSGDWIFSAPKPDVPADPVKGTPARQAFAADSCHPHAETGHQLYTAAISRALVKLESQGTPGIRALPAPFVPDNHEAARFIPLRLDFLDANWHSLDLTTHEVAKHFANRVPVLCCANAPGATLHFSFRGRSAAIYDLLGPDGGELEVIVDGRKPRAVRRFDAYCTYHRLGMTDLLSEPEVADHEVTVRLTDKTFNKAEILRQNGNRIDDEARYAPRRWYAGALLIDGELRP